MYLDYMLKLGASLSVSQAIEDLDSLSTVFLSFAIAEQEQKAEIESK